MVLHLWKNAGVCINIDKSSHYSKRFDTWAAALTLSVSVFVFDTAVAQRQILCSHRFFRASVFVASNGGKAHGKQCWSWSWLILPQPSWSHIFLMPFGTSGQKQQTSGRSSLGATVTYFSLGFFFNQLITSISISCSAFRPIAFFPARKKTQILCILDRDDTGLTADGFQLKAQTVGSSTTCWRYIENDVMSG